MSLVIGIKCDDGSIVVASDTAMSLRGDSADYVSVKLEKIYCEGDYILAMAGAVWLNQKVRRLAKEIFKDRTDFTQDMFRDFLDGTGEIIKEDILLRLSKGLESEEEIKNSIAIDVLIAYRDREKGENKIWVEDNTLRGRYVEEKFVVFSGNDLAYMPLKEFEESEIGVQEGKLLAFKAVKDTMRLSSSFVAEPIDIVVLDNEGKISRLEKNEIQNIAKAYDKMRIELYGLLRTAANDIDKQHKLRSKN
ncbi:MAG: hypothetical protein ACP5SJ_00195 [Candidatus Micrarchaeia archaeon]